MYLDAYVAASQCKAISEYDNPDDIYGKLSETAIFICYDNWLKSGKSFTPSHLSKDLNLGEHNFKNI